MPWGLMVLAVCSWVVYRRAVDASRSPILWVLVLWISILAGATVGMTAGMVFSNIGMSDIAIPVGGVCGMLAAVVVVAQLAGKPAQRIGGPPRQ